MIYLILSIICSTLIIVIIRSYEKWKIETEFGIAFNYLFCCFTGLLVMEESKPIDEITHWNGWWICLLLGVSFIFIFNLIGKSTKLLGITTTSISYKLSFIIPVIISILYYGDKVTFLKVLGILMALTAVYFITYLPPRKDTVLKKQELGSTMSLSLPVIIFISSGITDASFNFIQRNYTPPGFEHIVTITVFFGAFLSGMILSGFKKELYQWKNVLAGIVLGIPNYGSLYFLLQALKQPNVLPSTLFPINNLGIVGLSTLAGLLIFKERFSARKIAGFILAISSIIIIGFFS
jgi:drug/metabolite transporter (DMT)-like permease